MAAYFIVDVDVQNPTAMREYIEKVPGTLEPYGGRYIVRGGKFEVIEGDWQPTRVVMLEFPSMEQAKRWYACDEYAPFKQVRLDSCVTNMVLVEGM